MRPYRIRYSRGLFLILAVVLVVGLIGYARDWFGTKKTVAGNDAASPTVGTKADGKSAAPTLETLRLPVALGSVVNPPPIATPTTIPATRPVNPKGAFADAARLKNTGDLLGARAVMMTALNSGSLTPAEHEEAIAVLSDLNGGIIFTTKKFPADPLADQYVVKPGEVMQSIARRYDVPWEFVGRLNNISDPRKLQAGKTLKLYRGPFHALVNKKTYTLDVFAGGKPGEPNSVFIKRFRVGLGENDSTPTGVWLVEPQKKLKNPVYYSPRTEGPRVIDADDPANPLGERWIGLVGIEGNAKGRESYGIHGTIEPDSIGKMKSLGCVRLLNEDVEWVYDMLVEGKSTVTVVE